eukprot:6704116-Heterocapsa_arctica.AAC.1
MRRISAVSVDVQDFSQQRAAPPCATRVGRWAGFPPGRSMCRISPAALRVTLRCRLQPRSVCRRERSPPSA